MTTTVVKKKKSRPVKLGERTSSVTKRKDTTEIFDQCRWTATDFQQNATVCVLQQAMITCVRLSPGFENYLKRSAKSVHILSHAPVTTPSGLFFYVHNTRTQHLKHVFLLEMTKWGNASTIFKCFQESLTNHTMMFRFVKRSTLVDFFHYCPCFL